MQTIAIHQMQMPPISLDMRRNDRYFPGQLLHSDKEAMECFYCWRTCPFCCCKERLAKAAYMDIYSNGVLIGKPMFNCCGLGCCAPDTSYGGFVPFDNPVVFNDTAVKGECCSPCPFCCVNQCDCCGEVIVMRGRCGPCTGTSFFAQHNEMTLPCWCPLAPCCCNISAMYGLTAGEANRAAAVLNAAMTTFKSGGSWPKEARVAQSLAGPMPVTMMMPAYANASSPTYPAAGSPTDAPAPGQPLSKKEV